MTENAYLYIIGPLVTAVIAGVGYLVKYILNKRDKKHEEEIDERNRRRDEIESRLTKAEQKQAKAEQNQAETDKKLSLVIVAIAECEHKDCPTRAKLGTIMNINQTFDQHGEA